LEEDLAGASSYDKQMAAAFKEAAQAKGIQVEYGVSEHETPYEVPGKPKIRYFALVIRKEAYLHLVEQENAHYRTIHEADARFESRVPEPHEAYEPCSSLSLDAMKQQATYAGGQRSLLMAISKAAHAFAVQQKQQKAI